MAVIRTFHIDLHVNGDGAYAYIAEPDDSAAHPGVVIIQEWWGIEPHVCSLAQRLATEGFVAAVPDLYHGKVATEPDDAAKMMMLLTDHVERASREIIGALDTLQARANVIPKKLGLMGFCVGGMLTHKVAARYPNLGAVIPFYAYGYDPVPAEVARVNAPVLAIFGSLDESTPPERIERTRHVYQEAGKDITIKVYHAGHAFINPDHGDGNEQAAAEAWPAAVNFLRQHLK